MEYKIQSLVNFRRLSDARWAACNIRHDDDKIPTLEKATEMADAAIAAYLGIDWQDFCDKYREEEEVK